MLGITHRNLNDFATCGVAKLSTVSRRGNKWTGECSAAFDELNLQLILAPILAYPNFSDTFVLDTDASIMGVCAVLSKGRRERNESYLPALYSVTNKQIGGVVS